MASSASCPSEPLLRAIAVLQPERAAQAANNECATTSCNSNSNIILVQTNLLELLFAKAQRSPHCTPSTARAKAFATGDKTSNPSGETPKVGGHSTASKTPRRRKFPRQSRRFCRQPQAKLPTRLLVLRETSFTPATTLRSSLSSQR